MAKAIEATIDQAAGTLIVQVAGIGSITVDAASVSRENCDYAMYHGFKQRVCDAGALGYNKELGRYATNQEKYDSMKAIADHLNSGSVEWNVTREGGVGRVSLLAQAIAELKGKEVAEVHAALKDMSAADKAKLALHPEVKAIIDRMQSGNADQAKADELLGNL